VYLSSPDTHFTLIFLIQFETMDGEVVVEKLVTTPFVMQSNKVYKGKGK
jgi:hypothetical protein